MLNIDLPADLHFEDDQGFHYALRNGADKLIADRKAYAMYAKAQRHKGFERVHVTFDGEGSPDSTGRIR